MTDLIECHSGSEALIVSFPHTGIDIPIEFEPRLTSAWLARKDTDWWIDRLYDMAQRLGASTVRTRLSRTVIDVNRDPSGQSLYPGRATTELCPLTTFDGEPLYRRHCEPDASEVARRRSVFFDPYHRALADEIERVRAVHGRVVLYDAHSIRSRVPRLFDGLLPNFNIGTHDGRACSARLTAAVQAACRNSAYSQVTNGIFKGGWTTRHYGSPVSGVHAIQMELSCRGYLDEPTEELNSGNWPPAFDTARAAPLRARLTDALSACLDFARSIQGEGG